MSARAQLLAAVRRFPAREFLLFVALVVASSLVVLGVAEIYEPAAYIVAGLLTAGLGVLFLAETAD